MYSAKLWVNYYSLTPETPGHTDGHRIQDQDEHMHTARNSAKDAFMGVCFG